MHKESRFTTAKVAKRLYAVIWFFLIEHLLAGGGVSTKICLSFAYILKKVYLCPIICQKQTS